MKYLPYYKGFSTIIMAVSSLLILFGAYVIIFKGQTPMDNALKAAAVVVLACGYLMRNYIKIIEKYKAMHHNENKG